MRESALYVSVRPASWGELATVYFLGVLTSLVFFVLFYPTLACAGGPTVVTWNQAADCASVTGWELSAAPITTAKPNPVFADATLAVSIANAAPVVCGPAATKTVTLSGVGNSRYWLKTVAGSLKSTESNSVDASLPLGKPDGLTVVPQ